MCVIHYVIMWRNVCGDVIVPLIVGRLSVVKCKPNDAGNSNWFLEPSAKTEVILEYVKQEECL